MIFRYLFFKVSPLTSGPRRHNNLIPNSPWSTARLLVSPTSLTCRDSLSPVVAPTFEKATRAIYKHHSGGTSGPQIWNIIDIQYTTSLLTDIAPLRQGIGLQIKPDSFDVEAAP